MPFGSDASPSVTLTIVHCVDPLRGVIQGLSPGNEHTKTAEELKARPGLHKDVTFTGNPTIEELKTLVAVYYGYLHTEGDYNTLFNQSLVPEPTPSRWVTTWGKDGEDIRNKLNYQRVTRDRTGELVKLKTKDGDFRGRVIGYCKETTWSNQQGGGFIVENIDEPARCRLVDADMLEPDLKHKSGKGKNALYYPYMTDNEQKVKTRHEQRVLRHIACAVDMGAISFNEDCEKLGDEPDEIDEKVTAYRDEALKMFEIAVGSGAEFEVFHSFDLGKRHNDCDGKRLDELVDLDAVDYKLFVLVHSRVQVKDACDAADVATERKKQATKHAEVSPKLPANYYYARAVNMFMEADAAVSLSAFTYVHRNQAAGFASSRFLHEQWRDTLCPALRAYLDGSSSHLERVVAGSADDDDEQYVYEEPDTPQEMCSVEVLRGLLEWVKADPCYDVKEEEKEVEKRICKATSRKKDETENGLVTMMVNPMIEQLNKLQSGPTQSHGMPRPAAYWARSRFAMAEAYWLATTRPGQGLAARAAGAMCDVSLPCLVCTVIMALVLDYVAWRWFWALLCVPLCCLVRLLWNNCLVRLLWNKAPPPCPLYRPGEFDWLDLCQQMKLHAPYMAVRGVAAPEPLHFFWGLCTGVAIYSRLARREHAEAYTDLFQAGLGCGGPWLALGFSVLAASASMLLLEGIVPLRIEALRRAWGSPGFHVDGLVMQAPKDQGLCALAKLQPQIMVSTLPWSNDLLSLRLSRVFFEPLKHWRKHSSALGGRQAAVICASHLLGLSCGGFVLALYEAFLHATGVVGATAFVQYFVQLIPFFG